MSAGTPQAGATNAFSDDSAYSVASGATLALNGFSQVIGSLAGVAGASVTLGSGTLTAGGNNTATTYAGNISGNGGLQRRPIHALGPNPRRPTAPPNKEPPHPSRRPHPGPPLTPQTPAPPPPNPPPRPDQTPPPGHHTTGGGDQDRQRQADTLTADLSYTGATTVNGGTLQIDGIIYFAATAKNSGSPPGDDGTQRSTTDYAGRGRRERARDRW